jgi:hypothetical protein
MFLTVRYIKRALRVSDASRVPALLLKEKTLEKGDGGGKTLTPKNVAFIRNNLSLEGD